MNLALLRVVAGYLVLVAAALAFNMQGDLPFFGIVALLGAFFIVYTPPRVVSAQVRSKTEMLLMLAGLAVVVLLIHASGWDSVRNPTVKPGFLILLWLAAPGAIRDIRAQLGKSAEKKAVAAG